ncbi:MAG TPA: redoxin family protein, partial [Rhodanobacteraceae bacterium]
MATSDVASPNAEPGTRRMLDEFPDALAWVNRRAPLRLAELRGHVVLLVFWNATSTSCANLLDDLHRLEKKYPGAFLLVGVHTPRYVSQQADPAVLKAVQRCRLRAPVANDGEWLAWQQYGIHAWPTTLVLDANGCVAARFVGEGCGDEIEESVVRLQEGLPPAHTRAAPDLLDNVRVASASALAFPAYALATDKRLYVCDSGHHRVLECNHDGRVLRQFGSGTPGNWDGQTAACGLQSPQGLALQDRTLYVADTGNHCVRRIRLESGEVDTVLGTGRPAYGDVEAQGLGLKVAVNAPRAIAADGEILYVAAAGQHQILRVDLREQQVTTLAGDGRCAVRDGIGGQASFAQPGALAVMPGQMLIADSGGNAIRRLRFADLALTTLAGGSAWQSGCADGIGQHARLAWPAGIAV